MDRGAIGRRCRVAVALIGLTLLVTGCAKREDAASASASASASPVAVAASHAGQHDDGMGKILRFDAKKSPQLTIDERNYLTKINHSGLFKVKTITNLKIQLDTTELQVIVSDPEWSQASAAEQQKIFQAISADWQKRCVTYQHAVQPTAPPIKHCNTAIIGASGTTYKQG